MNNNTKLMFDIIKEHKTIDITFDNVSYGRAYLKERIVAMPVKIISDTKSEDVFELLHEIGHIITNIESMSNCLQEFLATQWAIDNCIKYNILISKNEASEWQEYIYNWYYKDKKAKIKNIPSEIELKLDWKEVIE